ncbi:MAG: hydrolase [Pseudomonadota bacterium]
MNNPAVDTSSDWLASQHEEMIATLKAWSNINSGSYNVEGINRMATTIAEYAEQCVGTRATITPVAPMTITDESGNLVEKAIGPVLKMGVRPEAKTRVLFCGHMDTVFPLDSDFQQWHQIDQNTLGGPGVADMKGGILVMLKALQAFERSEHAEKLGWDILLNSDEEIGSLGSAPHLAEAAKSTHLGMVYEPSMPDGFLAGARRGSGNYALVVRGKAAHAGREYHLGRNAIATLAAAMAELDTLNELSDSITLNLARIHGGGPNNVVPDLAICHFNIRVSSLEDQAFAEQHVARAVANASAREGFNVSINGGFNRPPKPATAEQKKLFELVELCGQELNLELGFRATGGCCDGNNLLAAGLPNIDTLGVQGGDIHSDKEYMLLDSLIQRANLSLKILTRIATQPDRWLPAR